MLRNARLFPRPACLIFSLILVLSLASCTWLATTNHTETLLMDWSRGDLHYGPDFITLTSPCSNGDARCSCKLSIQATRSKDFAEYVASLPHGNVPVHFSALRRRRDGGMVGSKLLSVGDWTADQFPENDRLLKVSFTFRATDPNANQPASSSSPANCFSAPMVIVQNPSLP